MYSTVVTGNAHLNPHPVHLSRPPPRRLRNVRSLLEPLHVDTSISPLINNSLVFPAEILDFGVA